LRDSEVAHFDTLIVGAGHAGAKCAAALHQGRYPGSIALVTEEHELPCERPPLSQDLLIVTRALLSGPAPVYDE
jgi:flavin-dependent dehydrogenase